MCNFETPPPSITYLSTRSAEALDQIQDRLQGEVNSHMRSAVNWKDNTEPTVELSMDEARLNIENLSRISHLLRLVSESSI